MQSYDLSRFINAIEKHRQEQSRDESVLSVRKTLHTVVGLTKAIEYFYMPERTKQYLKVIKKHTSDFEEGSQKSNHIRIPSRERIQRESRRLMAQITPQNNLQSSSRQNLLDKEQPLDEFDMDILKDDALEPFDI